MDTPPGTKLFRNAAVGRQHVRGVVVSSAGDAGDAMYVVQRAMNDWLER